MKGPVESAYETLADARPLVRPTHNEFEVTFLPPFGDPEVHVPSEVGTYLVTGLLVNEITEFLHDESQER